LDQFRLYSWGQGFRISAHPLEGGTIIGGPLDPFELFTRGIEVGSALGAGEVAVARYLAGVSGSCPTAVNVASKISQKQFRHLAGRPELAARGSGGYMNSMADAQTVLDAYRNGSATVLGQHPQGFPIVRVDSVTGINVNIGAGVSEQATNVFMIKGTTSPSVVPINPNWVPR
jgi:hypothetical protein